MKFYRKTAVSSQQSVVRRENADGQTVAGGRTVRSGVNSQLSTLNSQPAERGVALVITLILLAVTLVMAVAFLAISRRERGSVVTETGTVTARLAADSGLANAEAQILATVLQTTNPYSFGLLVSTNYINANGFISGVANPTNVNYDYYFNGTAPLSPDDFKQNVANLWLLPRAPVFAFDRTAGFNEFRFYLDLNRNGRFDTNGVVGNFDSKGNFLGDVTEMGDPEWIGVLERPDAPHGPNNKFLSRYAFVALPVGNTLDLNAIHNEVLNQNLNTSDGYLRNQGVGSWEVNLAAFLADLNTNEWNTISSPYNYNRGFNINNQNTGVAFDDARALLAYRYNFNYGTLRPFSGVGGLFPNYPAGGAVDMFPLGNPLMTTTATPFYNYGLNVSWPGAANTNHYFALASDLFDTTKIFAVPAAPLNFIDHLQQASTNTFGGSTVSTYDRYTFYRLLAQLGTDSAPESGKLDVNYVNVDPAGNIVPDMQTNSIPWQPAQFFTNAADRMLRAYTTRWFQSNPSNYLATYYGITNYNYSYVDAYGTHINDRNGLGLTNVPFFGMTNQIPAFGVTEIPVLVNSNFVYQPAVQRVLQLAANIYDATTNNTFALGRDFPSVFRPLFVKDKFSNIFIIGYTNLNSVSGSADLRLSTPFDASFLAGTPAVPVGNLPPVDNIYGVPWIIGAKKGFPSFNEISMQDVVTVTRKLQVTRSDFTATAKIVATNAQYDMSISTAIGVEFWNPYTNAYINPLQVVVYNNVSANLTNNVGFIQPFIQPLSQNYSFNFWPGARWLPDGTADYRASSSSFPTNAFYLPIYTNISFMTNQAYQWGGGFLPAATAGWQANRTELLLPHFGFETTNRLQAFILAGPPGNQRVIDYVHFAGPNSRRDLNNEIQTTLKTVSYDNMWDTNRNARGTPLGIASQMGVSQNQPGLNPAYWDEGGSDHEKAEIYGFTVFMGGTPNGNLPSGQQATYQGYLTNLTVQVPYTPTVTSFGYTSWQANDPLVHTLASDLNFTGSDPNANSTVHTGINKLPLHGTLALLPDMGVLNARYQPWGATPQALAGLDQNGYNAAYKDPLMKRSENWDFPGTKLPSVGWLGRIHRGTPWQTVFLKATNILNLVAGTTNGLTTWANWTGENSSFDAVNLAPTQDRELFDIFTTALNGNATRGQLPINVGASDPGNPAAGLAGWSAVFSGMAVPTNMLGAYRIIDPAGVDVANSTLGRLVQGIYSTRTNFVNPDGLKGAFEHVGDILAVPALSQNSPFLAGLNLSNNIPDALMEWLPQQTMGLLRLSDQPRFVIYSYGQTLTPAPNGVVNSGAQAGMITNYQVTAETVTRSVVRIVGAPTNTHAVIESYNILPPD